MGTLIVVTCQGICVRHMDKLTLRFKLLQLKCLHRPNWYRKLL